MNNRIDMVAGQNGPLPLISLHVAVMAERKRFTLHLERTQSAHKIALALTIADGRSNGQNFAAVKRVTVLANDFLSGIEADYFSGYQQLDHAYGWGLNYVPGSKYRLKTGPLVS